MIKIITGDCRDVLPTLPAQSVQCCVTSPPYWGLRDYGTASWEGGDAGCDHSNHRDTPLSTLLGGKATQEQATVFWDCPKCGARRIDSQIGLEATPEEYLTKMVAVFREVWRVLRDDGTLWVNMGDSYAQNGGKNQTKEDEEYQKNKGWFGDDRGRYPSHATISMRAANTAVSGLKPKDLCMMPARLAIALQADGWYLRSEIVWHKPNPMPESVTDRPTKSHEMIYLLAKRERYFYNADAIREPHAFPNGHQGGYTFKTNPNNQGWNGHRSDMKGNTYNEAGRNKRTVWTIATQPYAEAHFATFPEDLIKPCILAGSRVGDTVLDPFAGSGTTGKVAMELGRKVILIELNPEYAKLAERRTAITPGMF